MAVHSHPQLVEQLVDMDRKEELILAKQLRACRVSILPRVRGMQAFLLDLGKGGCRVSFSTRVRGAVGSQSSLG
jgi:hypothetical protein